MTRAQNSRKFTVKRHLSGINQHLGTICLSIYILQEKKEYMADWCKPIRGLIPKD